LANCDLRPFSFAGIFAYTFLTVPFADQIPAGWEASNMKPIGL